MLSDADRQAAQESINDGRGLMFGMWVLTGIVWLANIYDARSEATKYNSKRSNTPALSSLPMAASFQSSGRFEEVKSSHGDARGRLQRLAKLHKDGLLNDEEFQAKKKEILGDL